MIQMGVPLPFDVPIFDGADDVALVGFSKLDLDFVSPIRLRIDQKEI